MFTERNTSGKSLCCYDHFQENLCSHCVVMIIFKKNCAVTVVL